MLLVIVWTSEENFGEACEDDQHDEDT